MGSSDPGGSAEKTSKAAPAIFPEVSAHRRAVSSTRDPLAVLMKKATAWTANRFEYYQKLAALTYEKK